MDKDVKYDYLQTTLFITKFKNPCGKVLFIEEMEENYDKLW